MTKDEITDGLEEGIVRLDRTHRRRLFQKARRYRIFDKRVYRFMQKVGQILHQGKDFNKLVFVPKTTVNDRQGTIVVGDVRTNSIDIAQHNFDANFGNFPISWESEESVFTSNSNNEWEELDMNERSSQHEGTRVCKKILREVFGTDVVDGSVMYAYILKLKFSKIRIVPKYKKSIFEGYLLFTSDYLTDEHTKTSVINNIYSQYKELETEVEVEAFEEQTEDESRYIN